MYCWNQGRQQIIKFKCWDDGDESFWRLIYRSTKIDDLHCNLFLSATLWSFGLFSTDSQFNSNFTEYGIPNSEYAY